MDIRTYEHTDGQILYRVSPSNCLVKNRHISASQPLEKLHDEANESYLAAVFAHNNY